MKEREANEDAKLVEFEEELVQDVRGIEREASRDCERYI